MKLGTTWIRQSVVAVAVLVMMTVILGVVYPAVVWGVSRIDRSSAEGSVVTDSAGCRVGSALIGIDPQAERGRPDGYLHARLLGAADDPMAPGDPAASAASNQGPSSVTLAGWIESRRAIIAEREDVRPDQVPVDAVTGSGSSLDPHISPAYADIQVPRLARVHGMPPELVREVIDSHTEGRQLGVLGEPRVNVLEVNLALGLTAPDCG
ncbi:potassium-transporting ATPase subunit C [Williamsia muralis]|uniref:Potassium-transporting ATPase KdpC subunit n=1 Tax=Williamsia marianensis TaxID=85044 RepID=A0ABU4EW27_WILMA|nr:potassium-transporting ATPase subunit C [Williamsia muralis]MDV7135445.1 potassium-transporting ATPase subunit C [Williamsia muralis]